MSKYRVLGFDLSRTSTGVSIFELEGDKIKLDMLFSIKQYKAENFNRLYHCSKSLLMEQLGNILSEQEGEFTVAFELPVYGSYSSELQFYLTQEFLELCYNLNVNVVGYSPFFIKKFVKLFATDKKVKYPGRLQKNHIRDIYKRFVQILNKDVLPDSLDIEDSDSMDALFIGLIGIIFQSKYLTPPVIKQDMDLESLAAGGFKSLFIEGEEYYRGLYLEDIENTKFSNFIFNDKDIPLSKQFKLLLKDAFDHKHLSLRSKTFYPYGLLDILTEYMIKFYEKDPESFFKYFVKYFHTTRKNLEKNINGHATQCLVKNPGKLFLYPDMCINVVN